MTGFAFLVLRFSHTEPTPNACFAAGINIGLKGGVRWAFGNRFKSMYATFEVGTAHWRISSGLAARGGLLA
jgi:hypothetical protein